MEKLYTIDAALKKGQRLLEIKERSAYGMHERLVRDGFERSIADEATLRMVRCGLLSDERYAASFIRSKLASGWGESRIARELKRQHISLEMVPGYPQEFRCESEYERALKILSKTTLSSKNPRQAAYRRLVSKGYSIDIASSAAKHHIESLLVENTADADPDFW